MCPKFNPKLVQSRLSKLFLAVLVLALLATGVAYAAAQIISSSPLTIYIDDRLQFQVTHSGVRQIFPPNEDPGSFGTFLAVGGTLYGPTVVAGVSPTAFTPVSQTGVTGTGTGADPYTVVTTVDVGATGLRLVQTDSYVTAAESYRSTIQVNNTTGSPVNNVILYRGLDCALGASDIGYGWLIDGANGSIACAQNPNNAPAGITERFVPVSDAANYLVDHYNAVWAAIDSQTPLSNTVQVDDGVGGVYDNGMAISWSFSVPAGGAVTRSHDTSFTNVGYGSSPAPGGTLNVGSALVGSAVNSTLVISDTGSLTLNVTSYVISGPNASDFSITAPTFPFSIAPGEPDVAVNVRCVPGGAGARAATLTLNHNAPGGSATYLLTCIGLIPIVVGTAVDETTTNGQCSLREAISNANDDAPTFADCGAGSGADAINFALTSPVTITLASQLPNIVATSVITISGPDPATAGLTISGADSVRLFQVEAGGTLSLDNLILANGYAAGDTPDGGAILNAGTLNIHNCAFCGNHATRNGGAIDSFVYIQGVHYNILRIVAGMGGVAFSNLAVGNSATSGGGINNVSTPAAAHCPFDDPNAANSAGGDGGVIHSNGTLILIDSTFSGNSANGDGGAVHNASGGTMTSSHSTFSGNSAGRDGGAVNSAFGSTMASSHSTYSDNNAGRDGGGINEDRDYSDYVGDVVSHAWDKAADEFVGNSAGRDGGGINITIRHDLNELDHQAAEVYHELIEINTAGEDGGGINIKADAPSSSSADFSGGISSAAFSLVLSNTVVFSNTATTNGGGIYNQSGATVEVVNSTLSGNSADFGGGVNNLTGTVQISNSTLSGNSANVGGGLNNSDVLTVTNSLIANSAGGGDCAGAITSADYNLASDGSCQLSQPHDLAGTDPMLGPLQDNGGLSLTHALLVGSPAIDAGDCSGGSVAEDQRGVVRPQGAGCDIGAFEGFYIYLYLPLIHK